MYAGPKCKHGTAERIGYRHGSDQTTVVMGCQKIRVERPRVRAADGSGELPLPSVGQFQSEDPLNDAIMAKLLAGVSSRKYANTIEGDAKGSGCVYEQKRGQPSIYQGNGQDDGGDLYKATL